MKSNGDIVKLALATAVIAIGGWLIFNSLFEMFGLDKLPVWGRLILGLVIIWGSYKFGFRKE